MAPVAFLLACLARLVPPALAEVCHVDPADGKNTCLEQASLLQARLRAAHENGEAIVPSIRSGPSSEDEPTSHRITALEDTSGEFVFPTDLPPDRIDHACENVRAIDWEDQDNFPEELKRIVSSVDKIQKKHENEDFVKFTHAYGMPVLGISTFEDVSMRRSCYLLRYLFADNEWFRRWSYYRKFYAVGDRGGFCCPAQIGNQGVVCACNGYKYPVRGQGAPAHEVAHYFFNRVLAKMAQRNLLHIPDFVDVPGLNFNYEDTKFMDEYPPNTFSNFVNNSFAQDRERGSTKIKEEAAFSLHHYFIYTGMQQFITVRGGSGAEREVARKELHDNSPNLFNLVKEIWPCSNPYIGPCKDDAFGGKLQLAQTLKIGKVDPNDPRKMICREDLDTPEVSENDVPAVDPTPTHDKCTSEEWCNKTINDKKEVWGKVDQLKMGSVEQLLNPSGDANDHGSEHAWWLKKCCAKSAKFTEAMR